MTFYLRAVVLLVAVSFSLSACVVPVSGSHIGQERVIVGADTDLVRPFVLTVVKHEAENPDAPIYVCTLKPFNEEYRSESSHRGKAKLSVRKQCLAKLNSMFCEEKDIICTAYQ